MLSFSSFQEPSHHLQTLLTSKSSLINDKQLRSHRHQPETGKGMSIHPSKILNTQSKKEVDKPKLRVSQVSSLRYLIPYTGQASPTLEGCLFLSILPCDWHQWKRKSFFLSTGREHCRHPQSGGRPHFRRDSRCRWSENTRSSSAVITISVSFQPLSLCLLNPRIKNNNSKIQTACSITLPLPTFEIESVFFIGFYLDWSLLIG